MKGLVEIMRENAVGPKKRAKAPMAAAIHRLRRRMQDITLTLGLEDHRRRYVLREIDEWIARETKRGIL